MLNLATGGGIDGYHDMKPTDGQRGTFRVVSVGLFAAQFVGVAGQERIGAKALGSSAPLHTYPVIERLSCCVDLTTLGDLPTERVSIRGGKLWGASAPLHGNYNWAMNGAGRMKVGPLWTPHITFFDGQPLAGAGQLNADNGALKLINDFSGHYQTPPFSLTQVGDTLGRRGLDSSGTVVTSWHPGAVPLTY
jgi:hypothetical protein